MFEKGELRSHKWKFSTFLLVSQLVFLIFFAAQVRYDEDAGKPGKPGEHGPESAGAKLNSLYPMFQDVHVMIFIGFGFLMTFLKNYGFGSVGYNFLLSAFAIQLSIIVGGYVKMVVHEIKDEGNSWKIFVGSETLFEADFTCAAILISFGAVLGKLSAFQLLLMVTFEIVFFKVNEAIGIHFIKASDLGGSIFVHAFGAYFGMAVSRMMNHERHRNSPSEGSDYRSDLFSMVGTLFLWIFWPSFNSALATEEERTRSIVNTYLSLCASCAVTFALSSLLNKDGKLSMAHVQNATLAGGVAIGTTCNMMVHPGGSLAIGMAAGTLSTFGFAKLQELLDKIIGLHDTCGVNNLHGMPGVLAGICGVIVAAFASDERYGDVSRVFTAFKGASTQAGRQAGALGVTLVMALVGGVVTGLLVRILPSSPLKKPQVYNDTDFWEDVDFEEPKGGVTGAGEMVYAAEDEQ